MCDVSDAGCATALVAVLMSHTIIPSSCPLCVSVDVCKQRRLVSGHYTVAQASAERLTQAGSWETTNHIYALVWVFW